jgi:hypothetical protein
VRIAKRRARHPSERAVSFISATNASTEPETCSASATLASLPDWMSMPRTRSSTSTSEFTSMNIRVPPMRQAFSLTRTRSSSRIRCVPSAWNTTYAVMSFVRLAGGASTSAALDASTLSVAKSTR